MHVATDKIQKRIISKQIIPRNRLYFIISAFLITVNMVVGVTTYAYVNYSAVAKSYGVNVYRVNALIDEISSMSNDSTLPTLLSNADILMLNNNTFKVNNIRAAYSTLENDFFITRKNSGATTLSAYLPSCIEMNNIAYIDKMAKTAGYQTVHFYFIDNYKTINNKHIIIQDSKLCENSIDQSFK